MCVTCLRAFVRLFRTCLHIFTALRTFIFYVSYVPSFFLSASHAFIFLRVLRAFIFLCALRALNFLGAYILFMYVLIKLTQINELTYDFPSLLLLNSVI